MSVRVHVVDYSNSEVVCNGWPITDYLDRYMSETIEYTIGRSEFLEIWNSFIEDMLEGRRDESYKEYKECAFDAFTDLAETLVKKCGSYENIYDVIDLVLW